MGSPTQEVNDGDEPSAVSTWAFDGRIPHRMAGSKAGSGGTRIGSRLGLMDFKPQTLGALEVGQDFGLG